MRNNPGGFVSVAKQILSLFLDKDICLDNYYITDGQNMFNHYLEPIQNNFSLGNKKVYALINENTMSSAEYIFALGLKAAYNTVLVGQATMGLSGQGKMYEIGDQGTLRVTTKKYIDLDGNYVNNIKPDYNVDWDIKNICDHIDLQLKYIIDKEVANFE